MGRIDPWRKTMKKFITDEERKKPFSYMHDGILILLNRCDMGSMNYIVANPDVAEDKIAKAIMCFTCHWVECVLNNLNGFAGLDVPDWTVIREYCDHGSMIDDHMSGDITSNLEFPDGYTDGSSGFENVNLVDRYTIHLDDVRHPYHLVAKAISDEININNKITHVETRANTESIVPDGKVEMIGSGAELDSYKAIIEYDDGTRELILVVWSENEDRLFDFEKISDLPCNYELARSLIANGKAKADADGAGGFIL